MEWSELFDALRAHRNPDKAKMMSRYMRDQFEFLGIQTTERRQLSRPYLTQAKAKLKELSKEKGDLFAKVDWAFVNLCWQAPEREFQILATDYLKEVKAYLKPSDLSKL